MSLIDWDRIQAAGEASRDNLAAIQARIDADPGYQTVRETARSQMPVSQGGTMPAGFQPMWRMIGDTYRHDAKQAFTNAGIVIPDDYSVPWSTGQLLKGEGWHWDVIAVAAAFVVGVGFVLPEIVGGGSAAAATGGAVATSGAAAPAVAGSAAAAAATGVGSTVGVITTGASIAAGIYVQQQQHEHEQAQQAAAIELARIQAAQSSGGLLAGLGNPTTLLMIGAIVVVAVITRSR